MSADLTSGQETGAGNAITRAVLAGIVVALVVTVFDEIVVPLPGMAFELHYKKLWRLLPLLWLASLLLPAPTLATHPIVGMVSIALALAERDRVKNVSPRSPAVALASPML